MKSLLVALGGLTLTTAAQADAKRDVIAQYADMALAIYEDALTTAQALQKSVNALLVKPTERNLAVAKAAWIAARVPY